MNMLSVGKSCQSRICNSEVEGEVEVIVTVFVGDHSLTTEVSTEQRACLSFRHELGQVRELAEETRRGRVPRVVDP